jgi:co-chaperonin GroES (HSP10)
MNEDQTALANSVAEKIPYTFLDFFMVKPLEPIKVKKEFSKPVSTGTPAKDKNGVEAQDYDTVETEVKEVESDYRRGVVIKLPMYYNDRTDKDVFRPIKTGDIVVFKDTAGMWFDLVKDTRLLRQYDILGLVEND